MLQMDKNLQREPDRPGDYVSGGELLKSLSAFVSRQLPLMVIICVISLALGFVFYFTTPQRFTGTALLILDSHKTQLLQQQSPLGIDAPVDSTAVDSQVEILKSENVALSVIKDLHLTEEPEFISSGGLVSNLMRLIPGFDQREEPSEFQLTRAALGHFQGNLKIRRVGLTYVIEINYQSTDPQRAARIANAVAEAYIVDSLEAKYQASRRAASWLQDRIKELRAQASTAERAVADYKAKNNIVDAGGRLLNEQQLAEINSSLTIARAQKAEAQARYERITSILQNENTGSVVNDLATVTDSLQNQVITKLRSQYLDLAAREADWSARYGASHLAVVNLRNQMKEIRRSINDELRRIAETYKSDFEIAKAREESNQKNLNDSIAQSNDTGQAQIVLRELESNAQSYRSLADNFLQLFMVSVQQQSFPMTEARLITKATPPGGSSYPKFSLILLLALLGGGVVAVLAGLLRDASDRVFRTPSAVEQLLGVNCIALVPNLAANADRKGRTVFGSVLYRLFPQLQTASAKATLSGRPDIDVVDEAGLKSPASARFISYREGIDTQLLDFPFSRFAEAFRSMNMAAELHNLNDLNKVIGITSSLPNEGKSTIATSFAQLLAHSGLRTILVDGDLRNPSLSARLASQARAGLLDLVLGKASISELIWTDPNTKLAFLPCVVDTRLAHSSEILGSPAMHKLIQDLRNQYDRVIIDLSPLAPIVDVRATKKIVDSYMFVIEWGKTKTDVVEHVLREAPEVYHQLMGVVLNKADVAAMRRYEPHRGGYYYNQYYSRYGYVD
ncbi:succinoglycan biosynthesis transport protein ExoP [Bradyrhizobium sp. USDA 4449]